MEHDVDELRSVVEQYLRSLETFDLAAVLDCFTEDAFYSHPPYRDGEAGERRHEVTGHFGLQQLLERRGHRPDVHHEVRTAAIHGATGFVAGIFGPGGGRVLGSFVSTVTLSPEGKIAAYAAYSSVPAVGAEIS